MILQLSELDSDKACSLYYPLCYAKGRRRSVPFCIIASNGMTFAARLDEFDQQIALIGEEGEQLSYADLARRADTFAVDHFGGPSARSEEHTSELQSLMRISYAVFCLKKKN